MSKKFRSDAVGEVVSVVVKTGWLDVEIDTGQKFCAMQAVKTPYAQLVACSAPFFPIGFGVLFSQWRVCLFLLRCPAGPFFLTYSTGCFVDASCGPCLKPPHLYYSSLLRPYSLCCLFLFFFQLKALSFRPPVLRLSSLCAFSLIFLQPKDSSLRPPVVLVSSFCLDQERASFSWCLIRFQTRGRSSSACPFPLVSFLPGQGEGGPLLVFLRRSL